MTERRRFPVLESDQSGRNSFGRSIPWEVAVVEARQRRIRRAPT